jgi:hypothetical protein
MFQNNGVRENRSGTVSAVDALYGDVSCKEYHVITIVSTISGAYELDLLLFSDVI